MLEKQLYGENHPVLSKPQPPDPVAFQKGEMADWKAVSPDSAASPPRTTEGNIKAESCLTNWLALHLRRTGRFERSETLFARPSAWTRNSARVALFVGNNQSTWRPRWRDQVRFDEL